MVLMGEVNMKQGNIIKSKTAILIIMTVFIFVVSLILACSSAPKKAWYKPGFTHGEFAKDKYRCEQQAQVGSSETAIHPSGTFCIDYYCEYDQSQSTGFTNWDLFTACMKERGWSLVDKKQKQD